MLLSVIIPVYNAEKTLRATVESVFSQKCEDFEVLLIDDGSTDQSARVCDELANEYKQIKVIHKHNGGVSSARNIGIDISEGKYLAFIDADDKIAEAMFNDMLTECENKKADKVFCGFAEICEKTTRDIHLAPLPPRQILNREFIVRTMLYTGCIADSYMNRVWGSLYRTDLIRKYNLQFENRPMGEDWLFNMQYCEIIETALYIDKPYYEYIRNGMSATARFQPRQFDLWLENRRYRNQLSRKYNFSVDNNARDTKWVAKVLFYALEVIRNTSDYTRRLKEIFRNDEFVGALKNVNAVTPRFFNPVLWLLKKRQYIFAISVLRVYSWRIR